MDAFLTFIANAIDGSFLQSTSLYLLRNVPGFPPIIQTVHILGISIIMGTVVILNLRILGLAVPSQNITEMTRRLMPWFWSALVFNIISGSVFVFARPFRYFDNPIFGWKFLFLIPALLLTAFFHSMSKRQDNYWQMNVKRRISARVIALCSLILWILVPLAGRWIAYVEYIYYPA